MAVAEDLFDPFNGMTCAQSCDDSAADADADADVNVDNQMQMVLALALLLPLPRLKPCQKRYIYTYISTTVG